MERTTRTQATAFEGSGVRGSIPGPHPEGIIGPQGLVDEQVEVLVTRSIHPVKEDAAPAGKAVTAPALFLWLRADACAACRQPHT